MPEHRHEDFFQEHTDTLRRLKDDTVDMKVAMATLTTNVNNFIQASDQRFSQGEKRFSKVEDALVGLNKRLVIITMILVIIIFASDNATTLLKLVLGAV